MSYSRAHLDVKVIGRLGYLERNEFPLVADSILFDDDSNVNWIAITFAPVC